MLVASFGMQLSGLLDSAQVMAAYQEHTSSALAASQLLPAEHDGVLVPALFTPDVCWVGFWVGETACWAF